MKKIKEFLLFLVSFIALTILRFPWRFLINSSDNSTAGFISGKNYLKLWLSDEVYLKSLFTTFFKHFAISLVLVAVFAVVMFILRNKFRFRRGVFYILCIATGFISCIISLCIAQLRAWALIYTYNFSLANPSVRTLLAGWVLFALQVGVLAAFLIWLVELIALKIKGKKEEVMSCENF